MVQAFGELAVVLTALGCLSKVVLTAAVTHLGCFVASGLWICSTLESSSSDVTIFWKKNPSLVFLLCADLNIDCSKTKSSNDNPRHTARQINSTSVLISITVHSTEIVTIPKHTKTIYITGIHNSCMSQHNYFPTKSDIFIIKQSFIKANSVHKSVRAHALQCPKRRHLHCNAKQHNMWVYVTYMCQYSQVLSTIP